MNTRLTRLLGIQHPIVLPGMTYVAVPRLVGAVTVSYTHLTLPTRDPV